MLPLLIVVIGALGTARLTRLVTADQLTKTLRRRVLQAVQEGGHLEYLLSCAWCTSVWVATPVAALVLGLLASIEPQLLQLGLPGLLGLGLLTVLAYSQVTGILASREVEV